jgi:predicted RNA methylase
MLNRDRAELFLNALQRRAPIYYRHVEKTYRTHTDTFKSLGGRLLELAESVLGADYTDVLIDGYIFFVNEVNRSQILYEKERRYRFKSYADVLPRVYGAEEYMNRYHWGVYVTTFAWAHHLDIYQFYVDHFLSRLPLRSGGTIVDLGSGSGVWSIIALDRLQDWKSYGVDISPTSVSACQRMIQAAGLDRRFEVCRGDALTFRPAQTAHAAVSCFLLEHLENPRGLLGALHGLIGDRAYAFVTTALTAAEIDHIYEFRAESELLTMAEGAGFRVIAMLSSAPKEAPDSSFFLPRSAALVLQKKRNEIW